MSHRRFRVGVPEPLLHRSQIHASPQTPSGKCRARKPLTAPIHPDNWLRLYPVANKLRIAFHPTFQVLRRTFSPHGKKEAHPTLMQAQLGQSEIRTTLDIYT
ncbi:MAG TPA: hypothetical protein VMQ17_12455 [Candidatus Sulfotelmatobacter sp.]|nr:hypothetical protein [Candidatus Sulfotelmatobacter sp.]